MPNSTPSRRPYGLPPASDDTQRDSRARAVAALYAPNGVKISVSKESVARLPHPGTDNAGLLRLAESVGNMGHWYADTATGEVTWSPEVYRIFGLEPDNFTLDLHSALGICHPDDRARVEQILKTAAADKTEFEFDCRIKMQDGTWRTVISTGQPEVDAAGHLIALFGIVTDVTEAFDAIRSIQDQNEMLDLAAELAQLGHWIWSCEDNRLSYCSEEMARLHDVPPGTFIRQFTHPRLLAAAVTPEYSDVYRNTVDTALAEARPYEIEYRIKTRAGVIKDVREIGQPIFDREARLVRFIATAQDITEAKRRENELREAKRGFEEQTAALRRSEAKLRDIIEGSIQGIVVFRDFKPVFANHAYARLMGLASPDQVTALGDIRTHMGDEEAHCATSFWEEVMNGGEAAMNGGIHRQSKTATADGRTIWTDSIGRRIDWEGEPAFLMTVIDVTERYLAEEELKRKTRELQKLNTQKDKLFSIIAHDLRSPFTSVIGFADLLVSKARTLSHGQTVSYAQIVREAASGVQNLLDNLLAWASFQMRDGALKIEPLDMAGAVAASIEPLTYMAETKGVTIFNNITGLQVMGDEALVRIVVRNLLSNSIKFSRNGGLVQVNGARIDVDGRPMIRVTVRDDGTGISPAAMATLFELDRTVSAPGTRGEKGTGLGLYLCRDIVERHGGTVTVDSAPGEGTSFHFTLPAAS
jgi:PAS domain S-box-containing protein